MTAAYFEDHPTDPDKVIMRKPPHDVDLFCINAATQGEKMKARRVFHALMSSKGYTDADLSMTGDKYTNPAMQGRWNYFLAGWEMRGVM